MDDQQKQVNFVNHLHTSVAENIKVVQPHYKHLLYIELER